MSRLSRLRLNVPLVLGGLLLTVLVVVLVLPSVIDLPMRQRLTAEIDGQVVQAPFKPGQLGYILGSDQQGFDVLYQAIYAARPSLLFAVVVTAARALLAIPIGLLAGWRRGWLKRLVEGLANGIGSLPALLVMLYVISAVQLALGTFVGVWHWPAVIMVMFGAPRLAEQVRRLTEEAAVRPHIEAAVAAGATGRRIVWRHIFPLMKGDLLIAFTAEMGWVLLMVAQLAVFDLLFSGPSVWIFSERSGGLMWGSLMAIGRNALRTHPWIPYTPAAALGLTIVAFHLTAEGVRQRWVRR